MTTSNKLTKINRQKPTLYIAETLNAIRTDVF